MAKEPISLILNGMAGYEAEHTARMFFSSLQRAEAIPGEGDCLLILSKAHAQMVYLRLDGEARWAACPASPQETPADREYALCRLVYHFLQEQTGIRPPWGMMTGVRPVRIIHDMRAAGASEEEIRQRFVDHFECTPERFDTALRIAEVQRPILAQAKPMDYSLYAGIPFCPSRCSYCSFVSRTVGDKATQALVQPYVDCLCRELEAMRDVADDCGLNLKTLYIGGGTPTSLSAAQLRQLMGCLAELFDLRSLSEYTVEAGRPDCTDAEKLRVLKEYGATRISINPQTFSDQVLKNIGRRHSAQDILDCFAEARAAGHDNINMDLIAGLPGDTVEGFRKSLETAISLEPENITVHTLTLKRASNLVVEHRPDAYDDVARMLSHCELLEKAGYRPYYLYRQKGTLQNLENVGWCKPGDEGLYNIYIMEEVHTILSAGAGGSTKLVQPGVRHARIERIFNYKYPNEYIGQFDTVLARKKGVKQFYADFAGSDSEASHQQ